MPGLRKQVLWGGIGILCYIAAALIFLTVITSVGLLDPDPAGQSVATIDLLGLLGSVVLFSGGGYAFRRVQRARTTRPARSSLPSQYRSDSHSQPNTERPPTSTDSSDTVRCPNCDGENAAAYTFCQHCSEKLPE
jgi:hypothetical protein